MVKKIYNVHCEHCHSAVAMIELIFALVIMGIVMMSAPQLIRTSGSSAYASMQQEAILTTSSQIYTIMSAAWDESDTNSTIGKPILNTNTTSCTTVRPPGVTSASGRYCKKDTNSTLQYATAYSGFGQDGTEKFGVNNDIDDFTGSAGDAILFETNETTTTPEGDYIDYSTTISAIVVYADKDINASSGGTNLTFSNPFDKITTTKTTDIKLISVHLTSSSTAEELNDRDIRLSAFMCNRGAPKEILSNKGSL